MCLNCIFHFPADISGVSVRASRPGAVVLVKEEEANKENGLSGQELDLGEVGKVTEEVRAPRDTPGSESKLLCPFLSLFSVVFLLLSS